MKLELLLKKRENLEKQISRAQLTEKRKPVIADLAERSGILMLSDQILLAAFKQIAQQNEAVLSSSDS